MEIIKGHSSGWKTLNPVIDNNTRDPTIRFHTNSGKIHSRSFFRTLLHMEIDLLEIFLEFPGRGYPIKHVHDPVNLTLR